MLDTDTRLSRARVQLCLKQPYLASALMRFPLVEASSAVESIATDGYHFFWNREYVESITDQQLRGALAHVLMHILTQSVGRCQGRRMDLWAQATDYAINPLLAAFGFQLPHDYQSDPRFLNLTSEEVYDVLLAEAQTKEKESNGSNPPSHGSDHQACNYTQHPTKNGVERPGEIPSLTQDLIDPSSYLGMRCRAFTPNAPDQEEVRDTAEAMMLETQSKLEEAGKLPRQFAQLFKASKKALIDWQTLLADWLYDKVRDDWSTWPPSKKHIARGLYLPSVGQPAPIRLAMLIDTSGSMTDNMLHRIFGEVRAFRDTFPTAFTIIQADVDVARVDDYGPYDDFDERSIKLCGRGGTDFRSSYKWVEAHLAHEPVAIIHATDGWGAFPRRCDHPVIFLIPKEVAKYSPKFDQFPKWGQKVVI